MAELRIKKKYKSHNGEQAYLSIYIPEDGNVYGICFDQSAECYDELVDYYAFRYKDGKILAKTIFKEPYSRWSDIYCMKEWREE